MRRYFWVWLCDWRLRRRGSNVRLVFLSAYHSIAVVFGYLCFFWEEFLGLNGASCRADRLL
jgi:hypothetical protein